MSDDTDDKPDGITIQAPVTISYQDLWYILITAVESGFDGIGHWATVDSYVEPATLIQRDESNPTMTSGPTTKSTIKYADYPLSPGGAMILRYEDGDEIKRATLDEAALKRGLEVLSTKYLRHWKNIVEDNHDADTADALVQCAVFGELVFS